MHRGSSNPFQRDSCSTCVWPSSEVYVVSAVYATRWETSGIWFLQVGTGICTHILRPVSTFVHRTLAWCKQLKEDRLLLWIVRRCHHSPFFNRFSYSLQPWWATGIRSFDIGNGQRTTPQSLAASGSRNLDGSSTGLLLLGTPSTHQKDRTWTSAAYRKLWPSHPWWDYWNVPSGFHPWPSYCQQRAAPSCWQVLPEILIWHIKWSFPQSEKVLVYPAVQSIKLCGFQQMSCHVVSSFRDKTTETWNLQNSWNSNLAVTSGKLK